MIKIIRYILCYVFLTFLSLESQITYCNFYSNNCSILRRVQGVSNILLFQSLKFGDISSIERTFVFGDYRVEVYGEHLQIVEKVQYLEDEPETGFLTMRFYKRDNPVAYYVIYPTSVGYRVAKSQLSKVDLASESPATCRLIGAAREGFNLDISIDPEHGLQFDSRSLDILGSYLAPYFYSQALKNTESNLEAFILAVDNLKGHIKTSFSGTLENLDNNVPSERTIQNRLIAAYPGLSFSGYSLYYKIANRYPDGIRALKQDLSSEIKGLSYADAQDKIADFLISRLNDKFNSLDLNKYREILKDLGRAFGIMPLAKFI